MTTFQGFLFSKLDLIGSKSEGPKYFLQQYDYRELEIIKNADAWKEDPDLQPHLGQKSVLVGSEEDGRLSYEYVIPYFQPTQLELSLQLAPETVWLNKQPPLPPTNVPVKLVLLVRWPWRSIWQGTCETTQLYDFLVEREGRTIWRWSHGKAFAAQATMVEIPGSDVKEFAVETWMVNPTDIETEGVYRVRGIFLASAQVAEKGFEIRFAR